MLFSWLREHRRAKLRDEPFPAAWLTVLEQNVWHYGLLTAAEQAQVRGDARILIAEKNWEGCGGLELTDEIRVTIAAQAALLLLGLQHDYYAKSLSILVYPSTFVVPQKHMQPGALIEEESVAHLGQAWYRGPVILAWDDALAGGRRLSAGRNVVLHEFAHELDMQNGAADGIPDLDNREDLEKWTAVTGDEFERLKRSVERGRPTVIDGYGTTNPAEFFAVCTEAFFERPIALRSHHQRLYETLQRFYRQDPAERMSRAGSS
ncbi:MAG TPA: M90 family metallopeptidase [Planctomycetaceae bacterium]|nr:M90 family metallopeptidase [Planctomycetaceae bacterium]